MDGTNLKEDFQSQTSAQRKINSTYSAKSQPKTGKKYFATQPGREIVKRFKLRLRTGRSYSIPYALLPIIELDSNKLLRILSHDLNVTLQGRNLGLVEKHLAEERIIWIRESHSGTDDGESDVFVSQINVSSELFS